MMPVDAVVTDHLGDIYWAVGRKLEARFQWHRALAFSPDSDLAAELLAARMELLHQEAHEQQKQPVKPPPVSRWHLVSPRTVASLVTPRSRAAKANPEPELGPPAGAGGGPLAEVTATVIAQCSDGAHTTAGGALTARGQPTTADSEDPRRHSAPAEDLRGTMGPPTMEWLKAGLGNLY